MIADVAKTYLVVQFSHGLTGEPTWLCPSTKLEATINGYHDLMTNSIWALYGTMQYDRHPQIAYMHISNSQCHQAHHLISLLNAAIKKSINPSTGCLFIYCIDNQISIKTSFDACMVKKKIFITLFRGSETLEMEGMITKGPGEHYWGSLKDPTALVQRSQEWDSVWIPGSDACFS